MFLRFPSFVTFVLRYPYSSLFSASFPQSDSPPSLRPPFLLHSPTSMKIASPSLAFFFSLVYSSIKYLLSRCSVANCAAVWGSTGWWDLVSAPQRTHPRSMRSASKERMAPWNPSAGVDVSPGLGVREKTSWWGDCTASPFLLCSHPRWGWFSISLHAVTPVLSGVRPQAVSTSSQKHRCWNYCAP